MSEILAEMHTLSNEFAVLNGTENDLTETIDTALGDVREMIGDVWDGDAPGEFVVAAGPTMTRAQLDLEKHRRRVESGTWKATGEE